MNRLPILDESTLDAHQQAIYDEIKSGPRGTVVGPLRVWLESPGLAAKAQALGQYARYDSVLPEHLSELAILVTARYWSSGFEWAHHAPIALRAGVPAEAVQAIAEGKNFSFDDQEMKAVFDFASQLHRDKRVTDNTYAQTKQLLGLQACVDFVGVCGYYTLISMTINTFDVPDGDGPKLPIIDMPLTDYFKA